MKANIHVTLKSGVLDPQGQAVLQRLQQLGMGEAKQVRVGKFIEVELDAKSTSEAKKMVDKMCSTLLANTVIEKYTFEISE